MLSLLLLALAAAAIGFALLVLLSHPHERQSAYDAQERSHMPAEIATARLVLSERLIRVRVPAMVVAKTDQVYLTQDGLLVPVENKTRKRDVVYDYDRAEISVQGFVLRHGRHSSLSGYQVASYGYIRVQLPDGRPPSYHRVPLHSDRAIVQMRQRRLDIERGHIPPGGPASPRICSTCSQRSACPKRLSHSPPI